jgi:hypothetical protein
MYGFTNTQYFSTDKGSADMVFCDPEYALGYQAGGRRIVNDNPGDAFGPFLSQACVNMVAVTQEAKIGNGGHRNNCIGLESQRDPGALTNTLNFRES